MSQKTDLIELLRRSYVSPLDALRILGIYNFSARLTEISRILKPDETLKSLWVKNKEGKRFKEYAIKTTKGTK